MATSVVFPRVKFFADNGQPLVGGRIHTYVAGSSTRARTYVDAAKAQPNANPIVLDSRGEAAIYLAEGVEYKFVIEDRKGALIMTQEPVYGAVWPNAAQWPSDATLAYQYMTEAKAAAEGVVLTYAPFDTYAQMHAALPELPDGIAEVSRDETYDNSRVRYRVTSGVAAFLVNMDHVRLELTQPSGSDVVGGFDAYSKIHNYNGRATRLKVIKKGINKWFVRRDSAEANGVTVHKDALGRSWEMEYSGPINVQWAGADPTFSENSSPAFNLAFAVAKAKREAVHAPAGRYKWDDPVAADWPVVFTGDGGLGYEPSVHTVGTYIEYTGKVGKAFTVSCAPFAPGLLLKDFYVKGCGRHILGVQDGGTSIGMDLDHIGWTGVVENVTIDNFGGGNLSLGYVQDLHFNQVSLYRGGNSINEPLIKFRQDSNYVYFNNCHIENSNYMIKSEGAAWEIHFTNCHIETGDYAGGLGPANEFRYTQSPIQINGFNWSFNKTTFVPASDAALSDVGFTLANVPHYITTSETSNNIELNSTKWICPRNASSITPILAMGYAFKINGGSFDRLNPVRVPLNILRGRIYGGVDIGIQKYDSQTSLNCIRIDQGEVSDVSFGSYGPDSTVKTSGELITSYVKNGAKVSRVSVDAGLRPFNYLSSNLKADIAFDGEFYNLPASGIINASEVKPGNGVWINDMGDVVESIVGGQAGRKIFIYNGSIGDVIIRNVPGSVTAKGGNDFALPPFAMAVFTCLTSGLFIQEI